MFSIRELLFRLCSLMAICTILLAHSLNQFLQQGRNGANTLAKRANTATIVTTGGVQPRLEIRQLASQQPNQYTLFILALQQFQAQAQSNATSYYQIAGIHGVPRVNWNGVAKCGACKNANGYCTHDSVLFPAWHRVYLALFEQQLVSAAQSIAASWSPSSSSAPTQVQMQAAANSLRLPYWDWAAIPPNAGNVAPSQMTATTVTINGANGPQTVPNPLYQSNFASTSGLVYSPFTQWPNTLRYPNNNGAGATSQQASYTSAFNQIQPSLQDQVYQLMTTCQSYSGFSNDYYGSSSPSCSTSLEGVHNTVHTTVGGMSNSNAPTAGHMSYLSVAAFDPAFWLHHANIDRLFSVWQALYPNSYGAAQTAPGATWTIAKGSTQDANSPLTPFYSSSAGSTFWTTNSVRNWTVFGYTYPEFADSDGSAASIANYVNQLYGPNATATAGSSKRNEDAVLPKGTGGSIINSPFLATNGSTFEYVANIQSKRYALNGTYVIYLFLGPPRSENPTTWITDANLVGPVGVLAQPGMSDENDVLITNSLPLTRALRSKVALTGSNTGGGSSVDGGLLLADLSQTQVTPYLKKMLSWRILGPDGRALSASDASHVLGLVVSVYASTATKPTMRALAEWSDFVLLPSVTSGKAGGL